MLSFKEKLMAGYVGIIAALINSSIHIVLGAAILNAASVITNHSYAALTNIGLSLMALGVAFTYVWLCYVGITVFFKLIK